MRLPEGTRRPANRLLRFPVASPPPDSITHTQPPIFEHLNHSTSGCLTDEDQLALHFCNCKSVASPQMKPLPCGSIHEIFASDFTSRANHDYDNLKSEQPHHHRRRTLPMARNTTLLRGSANISAALFVNDSTKLISLCSFIPPNLRDSLRCLRVERTAGLPCSKDLHFWLEAYRSVSLTARFCCDSKRT